MRRAFLLLFLMLCLTDAAVSQNFNWSRRAAGTTVAASSDAITVDAPGNSYVTGWFKGTITFPSGPSFTSAGGPDIFVAKYGPNGNFLWAQQAKGLFNDWGYAISVDNAGNAYVTGIVGGGTVQFSSTQSITAGSDDMFIAKYNTNGVLQWVLRCGGPGLQYGKGIAVHSSSNTFYVTGVFENTTLFNTTSGSPVSLTSNGYGDIFVAYYNTNGVLQWVKRAGGIDPDYGYAITVDLQRNAYVTGTYGSTFTWGTTPMPSAAFDTYITKYNPNGNVGWVRRIYGPNQDAGMSISSSIHTDSVYVVGNYYGTLNFSNSSISLSGVGNNSPGNNLEMFIARYSTHGQLLWARSAGGPAMDSLNGVKSNGAAGAYVTGAFTGTAFFGPLSLNSSGGQDVFVAYYNANGLVQWVRKAGGTLNDSGNSVGVDTAGRAYITGGYSSNPASFVPTCCVLTTSSAGPSNLFIARIP